MDPLRLCLALGPAAIYLLLMGAINLSRRPFLVSGTRDAAALGLAISGFILVGPLDLFLPDRVWAGLGAAVWLLMACMYASGLVLVLLLLRPRLIVYNITPDQLRAVLADLVDRLDADARWAGDGLWLPRLGVQLQVESFQAFRNCSLVSAGGQQSYAGWRQLESALGTALGRIEVSRNPRGASLVLGGVLIAAALIAVIARDPQAVAQSLLDLLQSIARSFGKGQ